MILWIYYNRGDFDPKNEGEKLLKNGDWHSLAEKYISENKKQCGSSNINSKYRSRVREHYKERRFYILIFPLYWLAPIGVVYGTGWTTRWIIRGFRKEK